MPGTTVNGWPYVTPTDHPKEFPAHSQALANKLEADLRGLKAGYTPQQATDSGGLITVTHGLGRVPAVVLLGLTGNTTTQQVALAGYRAQALTATTFQIFVTRSDTSAVYANTTFQFYWLTI